MSDTGLEKPKRKRLPYDERREEFVQKAIEFFATEGLDSSTREFARRLGVTQPLLYRYFPSKDDLISEVYETVYVRRWRDCWEADLCDRSVPIRGRIVALYRAYTDIVFQPDWMRIFLFAGLKDGAINRRYINRVHSRLLIPLVREWRAAKGLSDTTPTNAEIELAWTTHGAIYYFGVRTKVYGQKPTKDLDFVITSSIDGLLYGLERLIED